LNRRDWWIGIALVVAALLVHAALPRYEWRETMGGRRAVRIDRWTGNAEWGGFADEVSGRWMSVPDITALRAAKNASDAKIKAAAEPAEDPIATKLGLVPVPTAGRPVAIGEEVTPICDSKVLLRPASGSELGGKYRGGLGQLKIANGTERDAVAVLIDGATEVPKRAIYVRSGEAGAITSVPNGNYRLRFQFGLRWLRERRFCEPANTSEFDDVFDFHQVATVGGPKYGTFEVTLHPVVDGTARTHSLSNAELRLPIPDAGPDEFDAVARALGGVAVEK
jgi:hypothetical protein